MDKNRVCYYVYDKKLVDISKSIPNLEIRAAVVQSLIATYSLLKKCKICPCEEATHEDLLSFHSSDYLECLRKAQMASDLEKISNSEEFMEFNLGYDCPLFQNIYEFAKLIAGSSLTAAKKLVPKNFQINQSVQSSSVTNLQPKSYLSFDEFEEVVEEIVRVPVRKHDTEVNSQMARNESSESEESIGLPVCINWFGGWHHAQRDEAGGFCYVNDIVIAVQYLLKFYKRVLYVDLDIHHGNGVENAFLFTPKVLTFSLHQYEPGFYPASGSLTDVGEGRGKFYAVNAPLKSGIKDEKYVNVFKRIHDKIIEKYQPDCAVVQCGADTLAGDPLGGFNLTLKGIGECLKLVLDQNLPTMVLGGGGYNIANSARCWAYLTSLILDSPIPNDIPDNTFLHFYGPEFELSVDPSLRKDENSDEYLQTVVAAILQNLDNISV